MAITRDIATVVEIIEHSKLFREGVLVRSDVRSVHGNGRVAIAGAEIAKNLVERAVFLDDVNHVMDFILAGSERNAIRVSARCVSLCRFFRVCG